MHDDNEGLIEGYPEAVLPTMIEGTKDYVDYGMKAPTKV